MRYRRESDLAWSTLEAAFGHRQELKKEFLTDNAESAYDIITQQLSSWAEDLQWPDESQDGIWVSTAINAEECCEKTAFFMRDRIWPFTKIIR
jgi:hypothetical protein